MILCDEQSTLGAAQTLWGARTEERRLVPRGK